ncbi:uncharacterized protein LOC124113582 [Haliotis rufescens]|uniref:uncharacterized protein LOC124113582 n=1 Tax=Haliotis rufescens TaxID=6454 RepID=UPI00201F33D3|nr:uncharacterized protein LOC124113582 [Haliotis rufescens]
MSDFGKSNESKPAVEEVLLKLKKQKASAKTAFTKAKNKLYNMTEGKDVPTRRSVRDQMDQLCIVQEQAMEVMLMLSEEYSKNNDVANSKKLSIEITRLEDETESAQQHAQQYLDCRSDASSVLSLRTGMSMLFNQKQEHGKSQKQECPGEKGKDVEQAQNESIKTFVRSEHELGQPKDMFTVDDASTRSYINADVAAELGLQGKTKQVTVNVLNDEKATFETMPVEFGLESKGGEVDVNISAFTTTKVTGDLQVVDWQKYGKLWTHLQDIDFPKIASPPIVDVLIGMDNSELHYSYSEVRGNPGEPLARLTPLGWTCIGNIAGTGSYNQTHFSSTFFSHSNADDQDLNMLLHRFWEVEKFQSKETENISPEDKNVYNRVKDALTYEDGHYQIGIPWKKEVHALPSDNYQMALSRLESTEKKLEKDETIAAAYDTVISQYHTNGYIRKVPTEEMTNTGKWYLPHFPVVRLDRLTTKVRIVFDASAKYKGISLNEVIHQGPKLQRELFDVLLRFRRNPVALMSDIAEMYLQVKISPDDRPYHRFLWRSMKRDEQPTEYEFSRVVFGVNASPFLAQFVSQENAKKHQGDLPLAAETVQKATYMDDSMDSVEDDNTAIELYRQLVDLWSRAGMRPRKWLSNSHQVLNQIPVEDRLSEVQLNSSYLPSAKTLGLMWIAERDVFTFTSHIPEMNSTISKRIFLRQIAKLFDPLGFLAPFTVRAKIILQEMWTAGLDWDEELDNNLKRKACQWFMELEDLALIQVPRCLRCGLEVKETTLHSFVDASEDAYGAVVYAVNTYQNDEISSVIIAAKGRVAPLKAISIPRMELMAAVTGLRLSVAITKALEVSIDIVTFWTDSSNVLSWIKNHSRTFKPFVANRVSEIQEITNPYQWRYVPTAKNPADMLTRGIAASKLIDNQSWWSGPPFLTRDEGEWPQRLSEIESKKTCKLENETLKENKIITMVVNKSSCDEWRLKATRYSDWKRLARIQAWVYRFLNNCVAQNHQRISGELTAEEIETAQFKIIAQVQREEFPAEYSCLEKRKPLPTNSKLLGLQPKLDECGVMRSDGRLAYAEHLSPESRFPIILPRRNWITRLIVKSYHEEGQHVTGTNQTLAALSAKFWILSGREEIREWERVCSQCRKQKAKVAHQIMAPLPEMRLTPSLRAFTQAGLDFAGPFFTVQGRGKARQKRYLCLFTCLASRAVHLEIAHGMDTNSFLNAFYRMASRRGLPEDIVCDNGTNFVGAKKELKELVSCLNNDAVKRTLANRGTKWKFNPPCAPHFGGVFETMIKAAKKAISAILGQSDVNDEELMTAFIGAEALINSRPLTYQTSHPQDDVPLTPNHFLHGQVGGSFAPESVDTTPFNPRKRWRRIQDLIRHFWSRWMKEWIPSLNRRRKWLTHQPDINVNDIVMVISPNTPRGHWPMGKVIKTHPGKDGYTRVVDIQIGQSVLTRPVTKVCPLETDSISC